MLDVSSLMPGRHTDIRLAMIALREADPAMRRARLIAARIHGRSGCNRLFTLRGHYDSGRFVIMAANGKLPEPQE